MVVSPKVERDQPTPTSNKAVEGIVRLSGSWRTGAGPVGGRNVLACRQIALRRPSLSGRGDQPISQAVWLYFRFPLGLRMVEEMLAARGIMVSHETVRQWALKFGQEFTNRIRRRLPCAGDKWHLDESSSRSPG
jgi:hypothetical protein